MGKTHDIVVVGATGYTGRLVVEHLARFGGPTRRFAIAGRDASKLREIASGVRASSGYEPPIFVASAEDRRAIAQLASAADVVLACAGPFARLGESVVEACVEAGTDYVDITGELDFVRRLVERYHARAEGAGLRLVPCCGFDSIPADLGVFSVIDALKPRGRAQVESFVHVDLGFSGGTWQTTVDMMAHSDPRRAPALPSPRGSDRRATYERGRPHFEGDVAGWVVPVPTIDPAIVLRSAALLDEYGPDFHYGFFLRMGSLPRAVAVGATFGAIFALSRVKAGTRALSRLKPSGTGVELEERGGGFFRVTTVLRADGEKVVGKVSGGGKYAETGKMAAEAALLLARERDRLPERAGVLTPAAAFGRRLIERLEDHGIRFEIVRRTKEGV
ncbi:MAG: saccharopine dehydrogenase NADP-binding domain-containing protein [Polyangiaceae bacterium]|jgi:short subunit dehydrogenase-like uncharacterized protein|nr:saccharopine dehydrogenase NADP-binding domain-containing protein [Polyangiaceae bacterium]MBK8938549.1 saccharopine dehydrogenase NADP-binding domain-containing protein [Polyangiaceae bacterium]